MENVLVLLSTYNGERYLREQLDSLYAQEGVGIHILVRDDGSSDRTLDILNEYSIKYGNLEIIKGYNVGATRSFYQLVYYAIDNLACFDFYAFCDQDDFWKSQKIITAVRRLDKLKGENRLYFCNSTYVDENLNIIKESDFYYDGCFKHCIIRNIALGCTMVLNNNLFLLAGKASKCFFVEDREEYIPLHDVWFYAFAHCIGASVLYDRDSHIMYRQHGNNVTQAYKGFWRRYLLGIKNTFKTPDSHWALAHCLYLCNSFFDDDVTNYLNKIVCYKRSYIKTISLALMIDLRGESFLDKQLWRFIILFRTF